MKITHRLLTLVCFSCLWLIFGCKNSNAHSNVISVNGVTVKSFYNSENNVELLLITNGDSSFVARPYEKITKIQVNTMALDCGSKCVNSNGVFDYECWKKCIKSGKFQFAVFETKLTVE